MTSNFRSWIIIVVVLLIGSMNNGCTESGINKTPNNSETTGKTDSTIRFASRFSITDGKDFKIVHLFGRLDTKDTTANFILYKTVKPNIKVSNACFIKTPCKRIISLSSIYTNMICELNCIDNIVAIENSDYYTNPFILKNSEDGKIKQVQRSPQVDKELVFKLKPDVIFAFGTGKTSGDFDSKIVASGIPVVISLDYLEESPLARAEWIKFFAVFLNKEKEAESIFSHVKMNYDSLKQMASVFKSKPTVFSELKFGDTWYVPGGKSFMAQLINDANADYLWNDDTHPGSLPLSFEAVYKKANDADYWLNVSMCNNKQQMLSKDKRYGDFKAFKQNKIYNNNLHCNKFNYSSYWETGMLYPNRILGDLIKILHPEVKKSLNNHFYYYRSIE